MNTPYETCNNAYCHGSISRTWGDTASGGTCGKCHGDSATGTSESEIAPPNDTNGDTSAGDPDVGAHQVHLNSSGGIVNYNITCNTCHKKPTGVFDTGHIDTALPAELSFGSMATSGGASPTWSTPTCTNTYCHNELLFPSTYHNGEASYGGSDPTPDWNDTAYQTTGSTRTAADCGKCHFYNSGSLDCQSCHPHVGSDNLSFDSGGGGLADHINGTPEGAGDCTGCHNGIATGSGSQYVTRDITGASGDFSMTSRHVFGATPTVFDCVVCHLEGNTDGTANNGTGAGKHDTTSNNKTVSMRNVDSISTGWEWDKTATTATMHGYMDAFCLACHDSDGSSGIAVNSSGDGITTSPGALALTPFYDNLRGPTPPTGSIVNPQVEVIGGDGNDDGVCESGETCEDGFSDRTRVIDVETQFDPGTYTWPNDDGTMPSGFTGTNYDGRPSQHAVLGPRYYTNNSSWTAWQSLTLKSGQALATVKEKAQLHCADCHSVDTNAHGSARLAMLVDSGVTGTAGTTGVGDVDTSCYACHTIGSYSESNSAGSRTEHGMCGHTFDSPTASAGPAAFGDSYCFNCHAGAKSESPYGWIHGMPSGSDPDFPTRVAERYRFLGGMAGAWEPDGWETSGGTAPTCYWRTASNTATTCNRHVGATAGGSKGDTLFDRSLEY